MNDPVPMSTRTIWLAAAGLFGLAFLVGLFKGSIFLAIVLLLIAGACVYQSRRAPRDDGANQKDKDEDEDAEQDEGDDDESPDRDEPADDEDEDEDDDGRPRAKRLWSNGD